MYRAHRQRFWAGMALFGIGVLWLVLVPLGRAALAPSDLIQLHNDSGTAQGYDTGTFEQSVVGAVLRGDDTTFPIAVYSVQAMFYRDFLYADPTAYVRAVIYRIGPNGRPAELLGASEPTTVDTFYPTFVDLTLAAPVTLAEPQAFLAGIEYLAGDKGSTPCVMTDNTSDIPTGKNFYSRDAGQTWIEHYDFWREPQTVGYNMVRAMVEPHTLLPTGSPAFTPTPTSTPTVTPIPSPFATGTPVPGALWPGSAIGYGKQHTLARGPDGRLHLVYFGPEDRALFYVWSDDNGQTWQPEMTARTPFFTFEKNGGSGSLGLDPDGAGIHLVIDQDLSTSPDGGIDATLYFHYRDGHWSDPERIASGGFGSNLAVGPDGRVHVVWSDSDVWYRVRNTDGTWTRARRLVLNGWHPDIDLGPNHQIHVVYNNNGLCCDATWVEVYYLHSEDGGQTWLGPEQLTIDNVWTGSAAGAVDPQGRYHVLYLKRGTLEGDLFYRSRQTDGTWTSPELLYQGIPTGQTGAESPALEVVDGAGDLVAAFYCLVPGHPSSVCLQARDTQTGWQAPRRLVPYGIVSPSLAGGTLNPTWVDVIWNTDGALIYHGIRDLHFQPTPTPSPTPTTTPSAYCVRVVDDTGQPRDQARVYRNGEFSGFTRSDGVLNFPQLDAGDELVALAPLALDAAATSGRTARPGHDRDLDTGKPAEPWSSQVFLTNLRQSPDLGPLPPGLLPDGAPGERCLVVRRDSPLILLNLTVSIEWDADQAYLDDLETGLRRASAFLYDVTDGQMALGRVTIFERGAHWADADIRIAASNQVFPHAAVAGITSSRSDFDVRLGPLWNGHSARISSSKDGPWSHAPGYRTIVHELGHYVLGLYDEYIHYSVDANGALHEDDAYCTHGESDKDAPQPANRASIMDNQHLASELADDLLRPQLWSDACRQTEQWDRNGESDWSTFLRRFHAADGPATLACTDGAAIPAAYCLWRPGSRGGIVPQPSLDPPTQRVWPWPVIDQRASPAGPPQRTLQVQWTGAPQQGRSYAMRTVVKQTIDGRLTYTEQGLTSFNGELAVFGAREGATLLLNTLDRSLETNISVTSSLTITLTLNRPAALAAALTQVTSPRLYLSPAIDGQGLQVAVTGMAQAALWAEYTLPGQAPQRVRLATVGDVQAAVLPVDLRFRASGTVTILGEDGQPLGPELSAAFTGRGLAAPAPADVFSADGRLWLHLPEGSVTQNTFVVVSSFGALPGTWPSGWKPIGPVYAVSYPAGQPTPRGRVSLRPDPGQLVAGSLAEVTLLGRAEGTAGWAPLAVTTGGQGRDVSAEWRAGLVAAASRPGTKVYVPLVRCGG